MQRRQRAKMTRKRIFFAKLLTAEHVQHVNVVEMFLNVKQEYKSALRYTNRLLQIEPQNRQGIELQEKITAQMKKGKSNCIAHSVEKK